MKSLFQVKTPLTLSLYSCSTFSIKTPSICFLSSSFERYFVRLNATNRETMILWLPTSSHICCFLSDRNTAQMGEAHTYTWSIHISFSGHAPVSCHCKKKVKYLSICINPPSRHLSNYCSHHKFKCESFADKMFSSHRLDNDWVGIIQKSPILYRSFKARMFFLLGKLRVTGSWSWERWEVMDGARQRHF